MGIRARLLSIPGTLDRLEADAILHAEPLDRRSTYDPVYAHRLVAYFRRALEELAPVERVVNRVGDVYYKRTPVDPPTFSAASVELGIPGRTLRRWRSKHGAFAHAWELCRAIQEHLVVVLSATSAIDGRFARALMVNYAGWTERVRQEHRPGVELRFDA